MSQDPQEAVYIEYLNYDWESFNDFQEGLKEILDNHLSNLKEQDPSIVSIPSLDKQQLIDQAKCFFYCTNTGNILSLDDFHLWNMKNGDKHFKNKKIIELPTNKDNNDVQNEEPPYSSNYQELVELIVSGKPVPGIKQIPDTVLANDMSIPIASQRRKPWEKEYDNEKDI